MRILGVFADYACLLFQFQLKINCEIRAIIKIAQIFRSLEGWRRWMAAMVLGAIAAAAQPPFFILPVLVLSFVGLVWLIDGAKSYKSAFGIGWAFSAGYFAAGLYWISHAFFVDSQSFAWMAPFALVGLTVGLGIFGGFMSVTAKVFWSPAGAKILALAAAWTLFEWFRGIVFTGFPWNPIGNIWVSVDPILQGASWIGVYGLSGLTVFFASSFALADKLSAYRVVFCSVGVSVIALIGILGAVRLSGAIEQKVEGVTLRVVQPNIKQSDKWRSDKIYENLLLHVHLSERNADKAVTHIIWPETAMINAFIGDKSNKLLISQMLPPRGYLLTGMPRFELFRGNVKSAWNSLVVVRKNGFINSIYDKHRLVPFGEYVPFRHILPVNKLTAGKVDFVAGSGVKTIRLPGLPPFSPLICYEIIFPGSVVRRNDRPKWILNITNDAWFGTSAGPSQHFASARMRAVEEGIPIIRVANTGISGVIDSYGRVLNRLNVGEIGVIDSSLPVSLRSGTLFSEYGNVIPLLLIIIGFSGAFYFKVRNIGNNE